MCRGSVSLSLRCWDLVLNMNTHNTFFLSYATSQNSGSYVCCLQHASFLFSNSHLQFEDFHRLNFHLSPWWHYRDIISVISFRQSLSDCIWGGFIFLWTWFLLNASWEFPEICYKHSLWLTDELIRIWWSKVNSKIHSDLTKHYFGLVNATAPRHLKGIYSNLVQMFTSTHWLNVV